MIMRLFVVLGCLASTTTLLLLWVWADRVLFARRHGRATLAAIDAACSRYDQQLEAADASWTAGSTEATGPGTTHGQPRFA